MSLAGCQINRIDVNFHLQKSLEIFDTNLADKIQSQNYKEVKVPCLMPIRVRGIPLYFNRYLVRLKLWKYIVLVLLCLTYNVSISALGSAFDLNNFDKDYYMELNLARLY